MQTINGYGKKAGEIGRKWMRKKSRKSRKKMYSESWGTQLRVTLLFQFCKIRILDEARRRRGAWRYSCIHTVTVYAIVVLVEVVVVAVAEVGSGTRHLVRF
jgi:hypothetical protein